MKPISHPIRLSPIIAFLWMALIVTFGCRRPLPEDDTRVPDKGPSRYQAVIQNAYAAKAEGNNAAALELFALAARMVTSGSEIHASSLDDRASVLLRLGKSESAEAMYLQAIDILKKNRGNRQLREGIEIRLQTLKDLRSAEITCREPAVYTDPNTPYFPNVAAYQEVLGTLTRRLADCHPSRTVEAITMRLTLSGDGKLVNARAKGAFSGTAVETCVIERLQQWIPATELPTFGACFRGFTYPFMVGQHPIPAEGIK